MLLNTLLVVILTLGLSNANDADKSPFANNISAEDMLRAMDACQSPEYIETKWGRDLVHLQTRRTFYEHLCGIDELNMLFKDGRLALELNGSPPEIFNAIANCRKLQGATNADTLRLFTNCFLGDSNVFEILKRA